MKKYLKFLFIAVFALTVFTFGSKPVNATETPYATPKFGLITNANGAFAFSNPALTSSDVTLPYGWVVSVIGEENNFYHVQYYSGNTSNINYVWVAKTNTSMAVYDAPAGEAFTTLYGYVGVCNYNAVDVRETSNITSVFAIINQGTQVNITGESNSWYRVQLYVNGVVKTGYIYKGLMTKVDAFASNSYIYMNVPKSMKKGTTYKLSIVDKFPVALSKTITWKSSNTKVATVSKYGRFKVKKKGSCKITATIKCGNRTRTIKLKLKATSTYKFSKK